MYPDLTDVENASVSTPRQGGAALDITGALFLSFFVPIDAFISRAAAVELVPGVIKKYQVIGMPDLRRILASVPTSIPDSKNINVVHKPVHN